MYPLDKRTRRTWCKWRSGFPDFNEGRRWKFGTNLVLCKVQNGLVKPFISNEWRRTAQISHFLNFLMVLKAASPASPHRKKGRTCGDPGRAACSQLKFVTGPSVDPYGDKPHGSRRRPYCVAEWGQLMKRSDSGCSAS
jgi:hypothetical protein